MRDSIIITFQGRHEYSGRTPHLQSLRSFRQTRCGFSSRLGIFARQKYAERAGLVALARNRFAITLRAPHLQSLRSFRQTRYGFSSRLGIFARQKYAERAGLVALARNRFAITLRAPHLQSLRSFRQTRYGFSSRLGIFARQKYAERAGFEPAVLAMSTPDFESGPFGHSGTSPSTTYVHYVLYGVILAPYFWAKMAVKVYFDREKNKWGVKDTARAKRTGKQQLFTHKSRAQEFSGPTGALLDKSSPF